MPNKEKRVSASQTENPPLPLLQDILYCTSLVGKAFVQDEFSLCFQQTAEEQRSSISFLYLLGVVVRYGLLLPFRLLLILGFLLVIGALIVLLRILGRETTANFLVCLGCRLLLICMGMKTKYYGYKQKVPGSHVFVSNHTTYLDYLVLSSYKFSHSVIAQKQPGIMSMLLKLVSGSVQFERAEKTTRNQVKATIKTVAQSTSLLVFPEGTCVNNKYTVMFQKGAFEMNVPVCPVAIKYNRNLADPYWNTRKQSFSKHFIYIITRWKTEVSVWWLPFVKQKKGETSSEFASRVKKMISSRAHLGNLLWNGYLKHCKTPEEMKEMRMWGGPNAHPLYNISSTRK
ncbi:glycerol-3-phosphate O-acyltransferase 3/4 [Nematocida sp. LUAm3]|nr:glycerol-3-phosphate O-acyltransferase 3/4 [Nematocida sp. LUAm3]KAI5174518.1 glycerol-3-phosphate O-acyltransferase 3/4 [Nematocida sp. LUAm2]KAI5179169.1 glycerol-3-phosphate O-acyltransferase 3/4 [Nematocida sp. LUAm1]